MNQDQSIEESLETMISYFTNQVNTCMPAKIVKIRDSQTIDVQPTIKKTLLRDNKKESIDYPVIPFVPVFTMSSKDYFISFPIKVNDPVLLVFSQHSIDKYKLEKGEDINDSEDITHHDINGAIALIGIISPSNKVSEISSDNFIVGKKDGSSKIIITQDNKVQIKATSVELGDLGASKALAIAEKVESRISSLETSFNTHTHVCISPGSPSVVPATPIVGPHPDLGSVKVKTDS